MKKDIPFESIFTDVTRLAKKIPQSDYLPHGRYPIFDQGKAYIAGYSNECNMFFSDVPAIIFGDHTRIIKFITEPCFIGADGVKLLKIKTNDNPKYLYYALQSVNIPNTGYNRHFRLLKESKIRLYAENIQNEIVATLDRINSIIDNKNKQIKNIDLLAKSRFIEMFGDPITNPKAWETKKLIDVAPIKNYQGDFEDRIWLLNLDMVEAQTGNILDYLYVDKSKIGGSTCSFDESNILYSKLRPYLNKVVIPMKKGCATSELLPLSPSELLNRIYLAYLLKNDSFVAFISEKVAGAKMPRVQMEDFRKFPCMLPPLYMQNEFASLIQQLDKSKVRIKKSLEKLEMTYKALLQEYFG